MSKFFRTNYPGVEYREHPTRKYGPRPDRYYTIRYYRNKKRVREALGWASEGWTPAKAHKILCEIKANIKTGEGPQSLAEKRKLVEINRQKQEAALARLQTFAQVGDYYIEEYAKQEKKSWRHDRARLNLHLKPVLGNIPINDISINDIEKLKQACQNKTLAPATVVQCLALARQIINFAIRKGWRNKENPVPKVRFPKLNNQRIRFLSEEEEKEFFALAKEYDKDIYDICLISLYAGLRMGEIFALTKMDINIEERQIVVRDPKGGTDRIVPMHQKLVEVFRSRLTSLEKPTDLLFVDHKGRQKREIGSKFYTILKKLGWNEGITDRRLKFCAHSFRHTFGSRLIKQGVPIPVVQRLMGHSTVEMTMRYVHVSDKQFHDAIDSL